MPLLPAVANASDQALISLVHAGFFSFFSQNACRAQCRAPTIKTRWRATCAVRRDAVPRGAAPCRAVQCGAVRCGACVAGGGATGCAVGFAHGDVQVVEGGLHLRVSDLLGLAVVGREHIESLVGEGVGGEAMRCKCAHVKPMPSSHLPMVRLSVSLCLSLARLTFSRPSTATASAPFTGLVPRRHLQGLCPEHLREEERKV